MKNPGFIDLVLTCESRNEAETIAKALLDARLIACVKFAPVESAYWWKGKISSGLEVMMVMESREDLFDAVEEAVAEIHSYDTFVLQSFPIHRISKGAGEWLGRELRPPKTK